MRLLVALALLVPTLSALAPAAPAASETPSCQQGLPKPSSGALTLDRTSVRPGETTIGIVSGLATWPVRLFGGSGETFEACLPGPIAHTEVMTHDNAAYFLVPTSPSLRPGTYSVGLLFFEGGTPLSGGRLVRFDAPLTVTDHPTPVSGVTPACRQSHPAATTGVLVGPGSALTGSTITAAVRGLDPRAITGLNEYDHLDYIACLAGRATPITHLTRSDSQLIVRVPDDLAPGGHSLVIIGPGMDGLVTWRLTVIVITRPQLRMSPNSPLAGTWLSVSGSCDRTSSILIISAAFDNTGQHNWQGSLFGVLLPGPNGAWRFPGTGSAGSFSGRVLLKSTASGAYPVTMRCSGDVSLGTSLTVEAQPQLRLRPNPAPAGSWLSVSGSCPHTSPISLISAAFDNSGQHDWDGVNGVWRFPGTGEAGTFSGQVLLKSTASGSYSVGMRCGGGLARTAVLTVQPAPMLPATGRPLAPSLLAGGLSLLLGMILLRLARRRPTR